MLQILYCPATLPPVLSFARVMNTTRADQKKGEQQESLDTHNSFTAEEVIYIMTPYYQHPCWFALLCIGLVGKGGKKKNEKQKRK